MNIEELYLWCIVMVPLIFTPGPANLACASTSTQSGFGQAMRFAVGLSCVNTLVVIFLGSGMGYLYTEYRSAFRVLEVLGALYIVYLGLLLMRSKGGKKGDGLEKSRGFYDGITLQLLNAKMYPAMLMMFSQFLDGDTATVKEIAILSILMVGTSHISYTLWSSLGNILRKSSEGRALLIQRYGFGSLLTLVGLCLLFH